MLKNAFASLFLLVASSSVLAEGAAPQQPSPFFTWGMLLVFVAFFYFLIWRPQSKRQKEHKALMDSLVKNEEVVTNGGIVGKITKVNDEFVVIEVAEGIEIPFQKHAVASALPKGTLKNIS